MIEGVVGNIDSSTEGKGRCDQKDYKKSEKQFEAVAASFLARAWIDHRPRTSPTSTKNKPALVLSSRPRPSGVTSNDLV